MAKPPTPKKPKPPSLFALLAPYRGWIFLLIVLTVASSAFGLFVPRVLGKAIDAFTSGKTDLPGPLIGLIVLTLGGFIAGNLQSVVQIYASERVARDLRSRIAGIISL